MCADSFSIPGQIHVCEMFRQIFTYVFAARMKQAQYPKSTSNPQPFDHVCIHYDTGGLRLP